MVHNGIEYGDMQLCCEAYQLMKDALCMDHHEMSEVRLLSIKKVRYVYYVMSEVRLLSNE